MHEEESTLSSFSQISFQAFNPLIPGSNKNVTHT